MSADHLVAVYKSFSRQISVRHSLRLAEHCITFTALLTSMRFSLQVTFYPHIHTALYSFSFKYFIYLASMANLRRHKSHYFYKLLVYVDQ